MHVRSSFLHSFRILREKKNQYDELHCDSHTCKKYTKEIYMLLVYVRLSISSLQFEKCTPNHTLSNIISSIQFLKPTWVKHTPDNLWKLRKSFYTCMSLPICNIVKRWYFYKISSVNLLYKTKIQICSRPKNHYIIPKRCKAESNVQRQTSHPASGTVYTKEKHVFT